MARDFRTRRLGEHELKADTLMMSYGYDPALSEGAVKPPVFLTSTFEFETAEQGAAFFKAQAAGAEVKQQQRPGLIYSRFNHPNSQIAEDRLAVTADGDDAVLFASGMAAISSVLMALAKPGEVIVHSHPLYGGTETLIAGTLNTMGYKAVGFDDGLDAVRIHEAMQSGQELGEIAVIFLETPANPTNDLIDFELVVKAADEVAAATGRRPVIVCDNTMLGPVFQRPLNHGVDVDIYSLTKYVGGHSDLVAGAAVGRHPHIHAIRKIRSALGNQLDPHSSWMITRSMETLTLRMRRADESARRIARWLAEHAAVASVVHPDLISDADYQACYTRQCSGAGSTFSFTLSGGQAAAYAVLNALHLFKLAVSLGGSESLASHPASMTHAGVPLEMRNALGVGPGLIRLSIGLEDADDLIKDLELALEHIQR